LAVSDPCGFWEVAGGVGKIQNPDTWQNEKSVYGGYDSCRAEVGTDVCWEVVGSAERGVERVGYSFGIKIIESISIPETLQTLSEY
jgi:hypothetical protein